jgi:hypothetical protein
MPFTLSAIYFGRVEQKRLQGNDIWKSMDAYLGLLQNNFDLIHRSVTGASAMASGYAAHEMNGFIEAVCESLTQLKLEKQWFQCQQNGGGLELLAEQ